MIGAEVSTSKKMLDKPISEGVEQALLFAADRGAETADAKVTAQSTDTGFLRESLVTPKVVEDGGERVVQWGYTAPHAPHIEFGTAPHWPPIEPLKGWARRVLGDEDAAYAVQKSIAENGTEPQPFFRPGIEAMRRNLKGQEFKSRVDSNVE